MDKSANNLHRLHVPRAMPKWWQPWCEPVATSTPYLGVAIKPRLPRRRLPEMSRCLSFWPTRVEKVSRSLARKLIQSIMIREGASNQIIREARKVKYHSFAWRTPLQGNVILFHSCSNYLISASHPWRAFPADMAPFKGPWLAMCITFLTTENQGRTVRCFTLGAEVPWHHQQVQLTQTLIVHLLKTLFCCSDVAFSIFFFYNTYALF